MPDPVVPTKLKKVIPHCGFCQRDLKYVRVSGSERTQDPTLSGLEFNIAIDRGKVSADVDNLQRDEFNRTSNPRKFLAELELWIEDEATEVHCPFCTHVVKLTRIAIPQPGPQPGPTGPRGINLQQFLQQAHVQAQTPAGPFNMMSSTFGTNRSAIHTIFDSKLSDQELTDILTDVDMPPAPGTSRADMLQTLLDYFYQI